MQKSQNPRKKKQKKPCKCGAWTHATTRSKLCPLNKKYNRADKDKEAAKKMTMDGAARRAAAVEVTEESTVEVTAESTVEVTEDNANAVEVTEESAVEVTEDVPITPPEPVRQRHDEGETSSRARRARCVVIYCSRHL